MIEFEVKGKVSDTEFVEVRYTSRKEAGSPEVYSRCHKPFYAQEPSWEPPAPAEIDFSERAVEIVYGEDT